MSNAHQSLHETISAIISTCNLMPEVFRDGIILCDAAKNHVNVSEKVCLFTGYTKEELIEENPFALILNCSPIFKKMPFSTSHPFALNVDA